MKKGEFTGARVQRNFAPHPADCTVDSFPKGRPTTMARKLLDVGILMAFGGATSAASLNNKRAQPEWIGSGRGGALGPRKRPIYLADRG